MTQGAIDAFQEKELPLVPMSGEASNGFLRTWIECQKSTSFDSICPNYTATISVTALNTLIDALKGKKFLRKSNFLSTQSLLKIFTIIIVLI